MNFTVAYMLDAVPESNILCVPGLRRTASLRKIPIKICGKIKPSYA